MSDVGRQASEVSRVQDVDRVEARATAGLNRSVSARGAAQYLQRANATAAEVVRRLSQPVPTRAASASISRDPDADLVIRRAPLPEAMRRTIKPSGKGGPGLLCVRNTAPGIHITVFLTKASTDAIWAAKEAGTIKVDGATNFFMNGKGRLDDLDLQFDEFHVTLADGGHFYFTDKGEPLEACIATGAWSPVLTDPRWRTAALHAATIASCSADSIIAKLPEPPPPPKPAMSSADALKVMKPRSVKMKEAAAKPAPAAATKRTADGAAAEAPETAKKGKADNPAAAPATADARK